MTLKSGSLLALLAYGLPVITTQHNPPDRELEHCLRLVSPRDVMIALTDLLRDRATRAHLTESGRSFARTLTWDAIADVPLQLYQSVWLNFSAAD